MAHLSLSPYLGRRAILGAAATMALAGKVKPALAAPIVEHSAAIAPGLYEIAISTTTGLVHVASAGMPGKKDAQILGLDPKSLAIRSRIDTSAEPAFGLAIDDSRGRAYTSNTRSGTVSVIDLKKGTVVRSLKRGKGAHPRELMVDEAGRRVFVSIFGAQDRPSAIWIIDTMADAIAEVLTEGLEGGMTGLAFDAAGDRLFATAMNTNEVVEIALGTRKLRRFGAGGEKPVNLAWDGTRKRLLCANQGSGTLTVLDPAAGTVASSIRTGQGALSVAVNPVTNLAYVANRGAGTVSVIELASLAVMATLQTGTHPNTVAVDRRSGLAYVSNKARSGPRGAPPPEDPQGNTVSIVRA